MKTTHDFLTSLAENRDAHARFINTLSMVEYIGARKILKSQHASTFSIELLNHVAEEIRHAQVLKNLALRMSDGLLATYNPEHLLAGEEAGRYIQTVDRAAEKELGEGKGWLNYLYTTLLVEERANEFYAEYEPILSKAGFPGILAKILREEESHLSRILASLAGDAEGSHTDRLARLRLVEGPAFDHFMNAVRTQSGLR